MSAMNINKWANIVAIIVATITASLLLWSIETGAFERAIETIIHLIFKTKGA